jgi:hypothetical protein
MGGAEEGAVDFRSFFERCTLEATVRDFESDPAFCILEKKVKEGARSVAMSVEKDAPKQDQALDLRGPKRPRRRPTPCRAHRQGSKVNGRGLCGSEASISQDKVPHGFVMEGHARPFSSQTISRVRILPAPRQKARGALHLHHPPELNPMGNRLSDILVLSRLVRRKRARGGLAEH